MFEIGLSVYSKEINGSLFEQYSRAGVSAMELSRTYGEYLELDFKQIGRWADEYGVRLNSLHLPFSPFNVVDISSSETQKKTLEIHSELIRKASDIGIGIFVVHSSAEPVAAAERAERMERAKESLSILAQTAAENGAVIAVEDLPRTCIGRNSQEILQLVAVDERLRVCLDMNHLLGETLPDFISKVGKKIVTTHVSDYDFLNERHWLPGEGDIDWQGVVGALNEVGYSGAWLYEVGFKRPDTLICDRELNCVDFVRNAKEIFENRPLTVIGRRIDGLQKWVE